jgi:hypothetical protein
VTHTDDRCHDRLLDFLEQSDRGIIDADTWSPAVITR